MKQTFLAGLLLVVPLLLLGWLYEALPDYHVWIVIGGIGGLMTSCRCFARTEGGQQR